MRQLGQLRQLGQSHDAEVWPARDRRQIAAREMAKEHLDWIFWKPIFESRQPETVANLMLTLCHQTRYLLDKMIARQEEDFKKFGGVRERMHAARTAARGQEWNNAVYSRLNGAETAEELEKRAAEIVNEVKRATWSIKTRKGWQSERS